MPILKNPKDLKSVKTSYLPGDKAVKKGSLLVFEDAHFSFYANTFPLLKELNLRALLAVAPRYILETTKVDPQTRLDIPYALSMQDGFFEQKAPFCTWEELHEMVRSGHVQVAATSFSKMNLTFPFVNLEREIVGSKKVLQERLPQVITSFIYPFGKVSALAHEIVKSQFIYAFH